MGEAGWERPMTDGNKAAAAAEAWMSVGAQGGRRAGRGARPGFNGGRAAAGTRRVGSAEAVGFLPSFLDGGLGDSNRTPPSSRPAVGSA